MGVTSGLNWPRIPVLFGSIFTFSVNLFLSEDPGFLPLFFGSDDEDVDGSVGVGGSPGLGQASTSGFASGSSFGFTMEMLLLSVRIFINNRGFFSSLAELLDDSEGVGSTLASSSTVASLGLLEVGFFSATGSSSDFRFNAEEFCSSLPIEAVVDARRRVTRFECRVSTAVAESPFGDVVFAGSFFGSSVAAAAGGEAAIGDGLLLSVLVSTTTSLSFAGSTNSSSLSFASLSLFDFVACCCCLLAFVFSTTFAFFAAFPSIASEITLVRRRTLSDFADLIDFSASGLGSALDAAMGRSLLGASIIWYSMKAEETRRN